MIEVLTFKLAKRVGAASLIAVAAGLIPIGASAVGADDSSGYTTSGEFANLPTSAGLKYGEISGEAAMVRTQTSTYTSLEVEGLGPNTTYPAHVHVGTCASGGGGHYQFVPGGSTAPPNEIHLDFTTNADGEGQASVSVDQVAGPQAISVVIHEPKTKARIACADLVPED